MSPKSLKGSTKRPASEDEQMQLEKIQAARALYVDMVLDLASTVRINSGKFQVLSADIQAAAKQRGLSIGL